MKPIFKVGKWSGNDKDEGLEFRSIKNKPNLKKTAKKEKAKKKKVKKVIENVPESTQNLKTALESMETDEKPSNSKNISSLKQKFADNLKGGRFRFLNEQLYSIKSKEAVQLFQEDNTAFEAYHEGYRQQVEKWPINPLDRIIKAVKKMPKEFVIGDFGCGDGRLAKSVPHKVFSIDLVSSRDDIIACDMANTPLKTNSLDCAVYCLSLMGINFNDYLLEANRLLKINGILQIAEISSRFENIKDFVKRLELCGFQLLNKECEDKKIFFFFKFKKVSNVDKTCKLPEFSLKACAYKKR